MKTLPVLAAVFGFGFNALAYASTSAPVPTGASLTVTQVAAPAISAKKARYLHGHHPKGRRAIARKPVAHIAPVMVSPSAN